jgi:hypothetical protein
VELGATIGLYEKGQFGRHRDDIENRANRHFLLKIRSLPILRCFSRGAFAW